MKLLFAKFFAVWALLVFIITLIPAGIIMMIIGLFKEPRRTGIFRIISKGWMSLFFWLTGCRLKVFGKMNFRPGEKYIVTCNHNSLMDVPVSTPFIPGANKTIAKASMAKIPLFGLIYKRGSVLVDRNDKNSRKESYTKMKAVLGMGMHVCIYPEGTRNRSNLSLKEFHDGAFKLSVDTGVPILPALIFNTKKILPPGRSFYFWPGKMELHFLEPVIVTKGESYEAIKEEVYNLMKNYYEKHIK